MNQPLPDWYTQLESNPAYKRLPYPPNREHNWVHAVGDGKRLDIRYFVNESNKSLQGLAIFGADAEGPPGCAHGGAIASLIDDAMGTAAWLAGHRVSSLNLNINMRKFVPLLTPVQIECFVSNVDGRKVTVSCTVRSTPEVTHADATGLFLQINFEKVLKQDPAEQRES